MGQKDYKLGCSNWARIFLWFWGWIKFLIGLGSIDFVKGLKWFAYNSWGSRFRSRIKFEGRERFRESCKSRDRFKGRYWIFFSVSKCDKYPLEDSTWLWIWFPTESTNKPSFSIFGLLTITFFYFCYGCSSFLHHIFLSFSGRIPRLFLIQIPTYKLVTSIVFPRPRSC